MKYLESVKLIQFFLYEEEEVRIKDITGIFGPAASGKSSLLDAVQLAIFGGNDTLSALNAKADDKNKSKRTLRSYCLGMLGENLFTRAVATSYITLVWRDSITNEPVTMGICISADKNIEKAEVDGRYILPGLELAMNDFIEIVNGERKPLAWKVFRARQLIRANTAGISDPFFTDAGRYIKAMLLVLRGSGAPPSFDSFKSAFRFAVKMNFNESIDNIVRNNVLENRPTQIVKFKQITDQIRQLSEEVKSTKAKVAEGEKVENAFMDASKFSARVTTWNGLGGEARSESMASKMDEATKAQGLAEDELESLNESLNEANQSLENANNQVKIHRDLRINHPKHQELGVAQGEINKTSEIKTRKFDALTQDLKDIQRILTNVENSPFLSDQSRSVKTVLLDLSNALNSVNDLNKDKLNGLLKRSQKIAQILYGKLTSVGRDLAPRLAEAENSLKSAQNALSRVGSGKAALDRNVARLLSEFTDYGVSAEPICDLIQITDPQWQPVIEAYLGRNVEALLVKQQADESKAFGLYRGLTGPRVVYGAKIVAASKQEYQKAEVGSVAELIIGDHPAAVAYLRKRFGNMMRANSDDEALSSKRTLTKDGMIVQHGEYDRVKPFSAEQLRIGGSSPQQVRSIEGGIEQLRRDINKLNAQFDELQSMQNGLSQLGSDATIRRLLAIFDEFDFARSALVSLSQRLNDSADEEYLRLVEMEKIWEAKVKELEPAKELLIGSEARAGSKVEQCITAKKVAILEWESAKNEALALTENPNYDREYAATQWDALVEKYADQYLQMIAHCSDQSNIANEAMKKAINKGSNALVVFRLTYKEQSATNNEDWRKDYAWMSNLLKTLRETTLANYEEQADIAFKAAQETFRTDVALILSDNLDILDKSMKRLNQVLNSCPVFSNNERYRFKRTVRPQVAGLLKFVQDIAVYGSNDDLLEGAGAIPEEFTRLLYDNITPGGAGTANVLDDYRAFFDFDIEITREDPISKDPTLIGTLSKRVGTGSGGEHRAPLYVIAGAALASAYRMDGGNNDGIRLMLIDEAFNQMDAGNTVATMRYLKELGLQILMASPGENLGTLTAFLDRYYDIYRDVEGNSIVLGGHDVLEETRELFREDLLEFNPELLNQEVLAVRAERAQSNLSSSATT